MIKLFSVHMPPAAGEAVVRTLFSGYITQGPKVDEFEQMLQGWLQTKNVVTVNSGTSALVMALRLAGVGPADYVVSTPMTCTATNIAIMNTGATPIFADVDEDSGLISPLSVEKIFQEWHTKPKAIMAVDWAGSPVDTAALMHVAKKYGVKLIVDSAHSLGTAHEVEPDFRCYSFQAIKFITTGDGGAIECLDSKDAKRARTLRWFGIEREGTGLDSRIDQDITEWGYKFHMNDISASIGITQMPYLNSVLTMHIKNQQVLNKYLSDYFIKPERATWLYTVLLPNAQLRDQFKDHMTKAGIQVSQVHRNNLDYTVFKSCPSVGGGTDGVTKFSQRMICLPVHWGLTKSEINFIIKTANQFVEKVTP